DDLLERGEDALPELDLTGADGCVAIGVEAQPRVEHPIAVEAARQPKSVLRQREPRRETERENEAAGGGSEIAPGQSVHHVLPFASAARSTARMMRLCVPQRQRLPSRAARTT